MFEKLLISQNIYKEMKFDIDEIAHIISARMVAECVAVEDFFVPSELLTDSRSFR